MDRIRRQKTRVAELTAAVLRHDPRQAMSQARERLIGVRSRLDRSVERILQSCAANRSALDARLHSLSPLAVLDRGYALVLGAEGQLIRSAAHVKSGDKVTTRLADGVFTSRVERAGKTARRK